MMKNEMRVPLAITVLAMCIVGCTPETGAPAPTVEYFRMHAREREEQMQRCANDPGNLGKTSACVNALQASNMEKVDSLRNLPSMGLNAPEGSKGKVGDPKH